MSRIYKLSDEDIKQLTIDFYDFVKTSTFTNGSVVFNHKLPKLENKANLIISETAYVKMIKLVKTFGTEVQWHGIAKKKNTGEYVIEDILLFPHEVTSTTVISNLEEYEKWLDGLTDEQFNNLRLHGHSHVNMGVTPSSVDMKYRYDTLSTMTPQQSNPFYIYLILNKRDDCSVEIYDLEDNVVYSNEDVNITIELSDGTDANLFVELAKMLATEPVKVIKQATGNNTKPTNTTNNKNEKKYSEDWYVQQMKKQKKEQEKDYDSLDYDYPYYRDNDYLDCFYE